MCVSTTKKNLKLRPINYKSDIEIPQKIEFFQSLNTFYNI